MTEGTFDHLDLARDIVGSRQLGACFDRGWIQIIIQGWNKQTASRHFSAAAEKRL
jgi:hypothetical protein